MTLTQADLDACRRLVEAEAPLPPVLAAKLLHDRDTWVENALAAANGREG